MNPSSDLEIIAADRKTKERAYWLTKLSGDLVKTTFPMGDPAMGREQEDNKAEARQETFNFKLPAPTFSRLNEISKSSNPRLFVVLLAALVTLLKKYTGHNDIIVGAPVVKQPIKAKFVNTVLVLRSILESGITFRDLLLTVRQTLAEATVHQNYPLNSLLYELNMSVLESDLKKNFPLFDIALLLENIHDRSYIDHIRVDMLISFRSTGDTIEGSVDYNAAKYSSTAIERIFSRFMHLLEMVLFKPDTPISRLDLLLPGERQRLLFDFNNSNVEYLRDKTLQELFADRVAHSQDTAALQAPHLNGIDPGVVHRVGCLTYGALNRNAERLAVWLRSSGVKPGVIVALMLERTLEMIVGIIAVLKAGGAYLPISLKYPGQRVEYILQDSAAKVLLTTPGLTGKLEKLLIVNCRLLMVNEMPPGRTLLNNPPKEAINNLHLKGNNLAYIIYTSGSTGLPKGVAVEPRSVNNLVAGLKETIYKNYPGLLNVCLIAPYEFDASVQQIFGALLQGHKLCIVPEETRLDGARLLEFYPRNQVDISDGTPSHIRLLVEVLEMENRSKDDEINQKLIGVKHFIIAGETFPRKTLERFLALLDPPFPRVSNLYGPTETCVDSTFFHIPLEKIHTFNSIPIGKPLPNQQVYILDKENQLLPPGIPGELCIGGDGVARGYLNRQELTAEKFDQDLLQDYHDEKNQKFLQGGSGGAVFSKSAPPGRRRQRLYRTGDLARWLPDGNIEFLGRIDHQVKLRGYRIELGEIENRLRAFEDVKEAVVELREGADGDSRLAAYVEPDPVTAPMVKRLLQMENENLLSGSQYHEFPNGMPIFYINLHEAQNLYREIFEEQCYWKYGIHLQEGACVFDLGANIGMFTLFIHYRCPGVRLFCFEPMPPTCEILRSNIRLHGIDAKIFQVGISVGNGEEIFTYFPNSPAMSGRYAAVEEEIDTARTFMLNRERFQDKGDGLSPYQVEEIVRERLTTEPYTCPVNTLSRVIQENEIETIDLLKIDVEKSEMEVLGGIKEDDWKKIRQVVIEVHNVDGRLESIIGQLESRGYQVNCQQDTLYEHTHLYNLYALQPQEQKQETVREGKAVNFQPGTFAHPARMISQLAARLKEQLPAFMIPSYFILLDRIPLTLNGKIDRKALAEPDIHHRSNRTYLPPRDEIEKKLVEIWSSVLAVNPDTIGLDADFFQLGGHSLRATLLVTRVHRELNVRVPLAEVFRTPILSDLAKFIKEMKKDMPAALPLAELKEYYRLSSAQKRLYLLQQMETESTAYNLPLPVVLDGQLDKERLDNTFRRLIIRHESFRTSFELIKEEPYQRICEHAAFEIEDYDLTSTFQPERGTCSSQNLKEIIENFVMPFDLTQAPLLRVGLIKLLHTPSTLNIQTSQEVKGEKHLLLVDMHHIISDGVSHQVLISEFMELYLGRDLLDLHFQYKDYSEWQNRQQQKEAIKKQEEHWLRRLEGEIPILDLPMDYPRPAVQSFVGNNLGFELSQEHTRCMKGLVLEQGATLYMVLLAIYNVLLSKISGQEDILVGTPIAARRHPDLQRIVGMFVNTLVIRNYPGAEKTFKEFLHEVKERALEDFENQEYTFEDLVEKVTVKRDTSRNPLFDAVFALDNQEADERTPIIEASLLKISPYEDYENLTAKFDLSLTCLESNEKLLCNFEYCTKLFKQDTIERFIIYFQKIVSAVLENSAQKIYEIEIITAEEKRQILYNFNDTAAAYPREKTIHRLFEEQVEQTPDHTALVGKEKGERGRGLEGKKEGVSFRQINAFGGMAVPDDCLSLPVRPVQHIRPVRLVYLTYRELNERSGRLACLLIEKGVKPDIIVGIMLERSLEMIIAILGILKAGGAYLPIDPEYPPERIDYMLKDSEAKVLVTTPSIPGKLEKLLIVNCQLLMVNEIPPDRRSLNNPPKEAINHLQLEQVSLAYVLYTSGSTGKPKGVILEHRSVVNYTWWAAKRYVKDEKVNFPFYTSIAFDLSVTSLFVPLITGNSIIVYRNEEGETSIDALERIIRDERIGVVKLTPAHLRIVKEMQLETTSRIKRFILGGENLESRLVDEIHKKFDGKLEIYNEYGPTEATVGCMIHLFDPGKDRRPSVPIGVPADNLRIFILDKFLKPASSGVTGELCISGPQLARGYLNQPELTCEKFKIINYKLKIKNKRGDLRADLNAFGNGETHDLLLRAKSQEPRAKFYRTGDLARRLPSGDLEYLGRIDQQVKIRGHRIELGEIEFQLLKHPNVKETLMIVKEDKNGDKYLCSYIVSVENGTFNASELRKYLSGKLPDYMIPLYFISLAKFPLTPNGKIDHKTLPAPGIIQEDYIAPQDEVEKKLVEIWSEVLGIEEKKISTDKNFFELGGHSLKAAVVISAISGKLGPRVPLIEIFRAPTIRQLGQYIKDNRQDITLFTDEHLVLLKKSTANDGHLFFIHDGTGEVDGYVEFCKGLNIRVNCWGILANRIENYTPLDLSIEDIAADYIKTLRKVQSHGPYFIAGWSLGGIIAFEMALQLETSGENVSFLGLIDAPSPQSDRSKALPHFTLETEINLLMDYWPDDQIKDKVKQVTHIDEIWPIVVNYLEKKENNYNADTIKTLIPGDLARLIPNYDQANIKELIYYLNMNRTLTASLLRYIPCGKINILAHYFKASETPGIIKKGWDDYCSKSLETYEIEGDHFSILKKPSVTRVGEIVEMLLNKVQTSLSPYTYK